MRWKVLPLLLLLACSVQASWEFDTTGTPDDAFFGDFGAGNTKAYPICMAAWVKYTNHPIASHTYGNFGNQSASNNDSVFMGTANVDGVFEVGSRASAGGTTTDSYTLGDPASLDNVWFPVIGCVRSDTNREVYANGNTDGNNTGTRALTQAFRYFTFGANLAGGAATNGLIAEVAIWNADLSAPDRALYNGGTSAYQINNANLIGYWSLLTNDSSPDDESGNGGPTLSIVEDPVFNADHPTITRAGGTVVKKRRLMMQEDMP